MQSNILKSIITVVITAIIIGGIVYIWQNQNNAPEVTEGTTEVAGDFVKPVITYPTNGGAVVGPDVVILGNAEPNSTMWAYINPSTNERLGINTHANGAGLVSADGTFSIDVAEPCAREMTVVVVAVPPSDDYPEYWESMSVDVVSEPVSFTVTGELPATCRQ